MNMALLVYPLLLAPLCAAFGIGGALLAGVLRGGEREQFSARLANGALYVSALCALLLPGVFTPAPVAAQVVGVPWLQSGEFSLALMLVTGGMHSRLCAVFAVLFVVVFRFSTRYLHSEGSFHRFFAFLSLFVFAMFLLVLSGNALAGFVAWELAGISSWVLIAYNFRRAQAAANATRVFLMQRVGDAGFLLGMTLLLLWSGSLDWHANAGFAALSDMQATLLALTFMLPAFVKSAQFPYTPWLFRAMEGPTPSSAVFYGVVMVHAGVFLVLVLQPLFERSLLAMALLVLTGALTTGYAWLVGRSLADIKTSMACATSMQTGLMFIECGLGLWTLAFWHLCAHAVVRCFLFLRSPSILHNAHKLPVAPVTPPSRWLQAASLQQGWVDNVIDWGVIRPAQRLAQDLAYFEAHVLDPLMGTPAPVVRGMSSLLQERESDIGARLDSEHDSFASGSGLAAKLTEVVAALSHWFEERFILQGVGRDMISLGRRLGQAANRFEHLLLRPRYLVVFVLITLLVAM